MDEDTLPRSAIITVPLAIMANGLLLCGVASISTVLMDEIMPSGELYIPESIYPALGIIATSIVIIIIVTMVFWYSFLHNRIVSDQDEQSEED